MFTKRWHERVSASLLVTNLPKELRLLITQYLPTFPQDVATNFLTIPWPSAQGFQSDDKDDRYSVGEAVWFRELERLWNKCLPQQMRALPERRSSYLNLVCKIHAVVEAWSPTCIHYLTPEVNLWQTHLAIVLADHNRLQITFDKNMTLSEAYGRFNDRLALFLTDVNQYAGNDSVINSAYLQLLHTIAHWNSYELAATSIHSWLMPRLERHQDRWRKKDPALFYDESWLSASAAQHSHVDALWRFASHKTREAVWQSIRDLYALGTDVQILKTASGLL